MRAITFQQYGDASVLKLRDDLAIPDITSRQVLVRVEAAALNPYDRYMMSGNPRILRVASGWNAPKMLGLGQDFAGTIVSIGDQVTRFKVGDRVFGDVGERFVEATRALSDYVSVDEDYVTLCPAILSSQEAAGIPMAGRTALIAVRDYAKVNTGQRVLVYGASGGVGSFIVQIAKILGAQVTAVCGLSNVEKVAELGADEVVNYQATSVSELGHSFHAVIDTVGNMPLKTWESVLLQGGRYVQVGAPYQQGILGPLKNSFEVVLRGLFRRNWSWSSVAVTRSYSDRVWLTEQAAKGRLKPLIGHVFPLDDTPSAMRVIESGHTGGKVVITIGNDE